VDFRALLDVEEKNKYLCPVGVYGVVERNLPLLFIFTFWIYPTMFVVLIQNL
jgi:hypothetical protein